MSRSIIIERRTQVINMNSDSAVIASSFLSAMLLLLLLLKITCTHEAKRTMYTPGDVSERQHCSTPRLIIFLICFVRNTSGSNAHTAANDSNFEMF